MCPVLQIRPPAEASVSAGDSEEALDAVLEEATAEASVSAGEEGSDSAVDTERGMLRITVIRPIPHTRRQGRDTGISPNELLYTF